MTDLFHRGRQPSSSLAAGTRGAAEPASSAIATGNGPLAAKLAFHNTVCDFKVKKLDIRVGTQRYCGRRRWRRRRRRMMSLTRASSEQDGGLDGAKVT